MFNNDLRTLGPYISFDNVHDLFNFFRDAGFTRHSCWRCAVHPLPISHASPRWANQAIAMDEILQFLVTPVLLLATSHWTTCRTVSDASFPRMHPFRMSQWISWGRCGFPQPLSKDAQPQLKDVDATARGPGKEPLLVTS